MKLKYYLRGLGVGVILTTIILMIAYSGRKMELTDAEIIKRAEALGMVMEEDKLFANSEIQKDTQVLEDTEINQQSETSEETESEVQTETEIESETQTESESETQTEAESEVTPETESETQTETEVGSESQNGTERETYRLVIPSGSVPRLICNELAENGVIEDAASLRQYLVDVGYATSIIVGEYYIPYGASNEEVYQILKVGPK